MAKTLSPSQSAALFDILSHHNTYAEIRDFRQPGSLNHYGPPFTITPGEPSTSPSLQSLVSKFLLNLPGLRDVSVDLWKVQIHALIEQLELANLSESYDKGAIGSRKTLSTAISALIEYPVRGTAGGLPKLPEKDKGRGYDLGRAEDLAGAFRDFMDGAIYGDVLEDLLERTAETDVLVEHEALTQAVHEFILVNVASFMHYTLILSPKGQYLLKLLGNANKLVPYLVIRQTLKIGNVASMISAMMKVVLARVSVTTITNWIGLTSSEEVGLNLMQHIISTVLHWDIKDLDSRASRIEGDKEILSKEQIVCLKEYVDRSPEEQNKIREQSQMCSISIILSILATSELPTDLTEQNHTIALEYLTLLLSIRDRKEIIRVLCRSNPDHLTTIIRTMVSAYEPVIRHIHNAVDLSDSVSDFQNFLSDILKMSKIPPPDRSGEVAVPTVGDFVQLLKKHQYSCHKFLHQCAKNGKELTGWYREWLRSAASKFQRDTNDPSISDPTIRDAGHLNQPLNEIFSSLPPPTRETILSILDAQSKYLDEMHSASKVRLDTLLHSPQSKNPAIAKVLASSTNSSRPSSRPASPDPGARTPVTPTMIGAGTARGRAKEGEVGPGAYLARWQDFLDGTALTPLRVAGDIGGDGKENAGEVGAMENRKPDVGPVVEAMGKEFRELLAKRSVYW